MLPKNLVAGMLLAGAVSAHPGHDVAHEALERREYLASVKRSSLAHCAGALKARGVESRNVARRSARIEAERQKRGLGHLKNKKRDLEEVLNKSHNQTEMGYTVDTDPATLFAGYNSCLLTPEVTQGPYCKYSSLLLLFVFLLCKCYGD